MVKIFFGHIPFLICLGWLIVFAKCYRGADVAKRKLTWFVLVCTVLYYCHASFFTFGPEPHIETLWVLCSLSVYPLYYLYIRQLVGSSARPLWYMILLPALLLSSYMALGEVEIGLKMHKVILALEVMLVCYFGWKELRCFDRKLRDVYSDTERYETRSVQNLLIALVATSLCSSVFNAIGKQYFRESEWLVIVPSLFFGSLLFLVCLIGYHYRYVAEELEEEMRDEQELLAQPVEKEKEADRISMALKKLMEEEKIYLQPDIKLSELALMVGTCRTYLSSYLNQQLGLSFSDYINSQRIEYAKRLLASEEDIRKIKHVAIVSGFSSEVSFYRNFKKFTTMTPEEWSEKNK